MKQKASENISVVVISNIIFEPYLIPLIKSAFNQVELNVYIIPYGEHNEVEYKKQISECGLIVVWLNLEVLFPDLFNYIESGEKSQRQVTDEVMSLCEQLLDDLVHCPRGRILWFSFEELYSEIPIAIGHYYNGVIDKINTKLINQLFGNNKVILIDLKHLIAKVGLNNAYNLKNKYRWNAPYSKTLISATVNEIHKQYLIEKGITKKCIVLDCDNVLWGGIVSEDGIENIKLGYSGLGRFYQNFQRFVLSLYYHGVILAICSKNDLYDVMIVFREHSEMILKEKHISCFQVNWGNKPDNIKRISELLNIGLESIVFVDDSPFEIEGVKRILPKVTTILFEKHNIYKQFSRFNLKSNVSRASIEKRNETYNTNPFREVLKSQYNSYTDYIKALEIKLDIHKVIPTEISRISELTQRTNKCTNGIRYTVANIKERFTCDNVTMYSLSLSDRFSDLGIVGAIEIKNNILTVFSLSCRALGRGIEEKMIDFILDTHQITSIIFKSTGKNDDIKRLLINSFPHVTLTNSEII